ncbi:4'-phosphopantetheinyl transferase superfamily protein [Aquimarina sp. I32.4]|uniref:4'-phosphopantetheinyl transferase family protein n=1 Tax=Aquimarina sp. I32.4 TaxID=2053903 RepID=UPI000CDE9493|nr:4'-phosphopantetheinyl transferase family protein [Aquimarina sp. I32.4]
MYISEILLKRENTDFKAGFCLINKGLPELNKEIDLLHPSEKSYYECLKFERRRKSYLLGRIAAKRAVLKLLDDDKKIVSFSIQFGVFQFPVVKNIQNENIQVSISHCNNIGVALAFPEEHPMGIDIEKIDEAKINIIKSIISDEEEGIIKSFSLAKREGFTIMWSIKEALSKILKTGLTVDFKIFEIKLIHQQGFFFIGIFKNFIQYKSISFIENNYVCSIVLPKNTSIDLNCIRNSLRKIALSNCI